ncbi:MAG TPA: hypothetical protein VK474_09325 [Chthoniobacterales bacterium]|nr:hypothetical protein [Chthoniobacterales bacterium]
MPASTVVQNLAALPSDRRAALSAERKVIWAGGCTRGRRFGASKVFTSVAFALATVLSARTVPAADANSAQVEAIELRYHQLEGQLHRAVHYAAKESGADGETKLDQAWIQEDGEVLKLSSERTGPAGRSVTEFFYSPNRMLMFVIARTETPLAPGGTKVEEERVYFGGGDNGPIRDLIKTASFKAGEPLNTVGIHDVARDTKKRPRYMGEGSDTSYDQAAPDIAALKANPPERDPRINAGGDSAKFRLIQGSHSPDGRYALAIGLARKETDWDKFADEVNDTEVFTIEPRDMPELQNYVVDLDTHLILGETGCQYFGTRTSYNHSSCSVAWSPDSATFVQLVAEKWNYLECRAGRLTAGPTLAGIVNVGEFAEQSAFAFLRARKDRAYRKHGKELEIALDLGKVTDEGVINLSVGGHIRKSDEPDDYFDVTERLRLRSTPAGAQLEMVDVRYTPKE